MTALVSADWLRPFPVPASDAPARLFCLPYAGGSCAAYRDWLRLRGRVPDPRVEVIAVRLPGRGSRVREPAAEEVGALARELVEVMAPHLDRPYGIYGHSMGGIIGLALAEEIARTPGLRQPETLFTGAAVTPDAVRPQPEWRGTDAELTEWLRRTGGTPASVLSSPALLSVLLPALRADLALVASSRGRPLTRLAVPVRGFAGADDRLTPARVMGGWAARTSAGFTLSEVPGGHFFLPVSGPLVLDTIARALCDT